MNNTRTGNTTSNHPGIGAIGARLAELAGTMPCPCCGTAITAVIADAAALLGAVAQLYDELAAVRLEAANLRAAMQATLGAADDGEPDPLAFLRWELAEHQRGRR